jgi:hypothetical protein
MSTFIRLVFLLALQMPQWMETPARLVPGAIVGSAQPATSLPCFFQTSWDVATQSYLGNGATHDSKSNPIAIYNGPGSNYFIFDGPVFYVGTPCKTTTISFLVSNVDPLGFHYLCQGGKADNGLSCTSVSGTTVSPNPAARTAEDRVKRAKRSPTPTTLACTASAEDNARMESFIPRPFHLIPVFPVSDFFHDCGHYPPPCYTGTGHQPQYRVDLDFIGGATILPTGEYAIGMATNCDNGHGGGGGDCGLGNGEGGPKAYNAGAGTDVVAAGTDLLSFKYFTGGQNATKCLLYDPLHDNSIGLPPALTSYDVGGPSGCTAVNNGHSVRPKVHGLKPHILNFVIWSK